jgi:hypothetical protein
MRVIFSITLNSRGLHVLIEMAFSDITLSLFLQQADLIDRVSFVHSSNHMSHILQYKSQLAVRQTSVSATSTPASAHSTLAS